MIRRILSTALLLNLCCQIVHATCVDELKKQRAELLNESSADQYLKRLGLRIDLRPATAVAIRKGFFSVGVEEVDATEIVIEDRSGVKQATTQFTLREFFRWSAKPGVEAKIILTFAAEPNLYLSTATFKKLFEIHPEITQVKGTLIEDNAAAFNKEYAKTNDREKAFKQTPFYKAMSRLGFSKIDKSSKVTSSQIHPPYLLELILVRGPPRATEAKQQN